MRVFRQKGCKTWRVRFAVGSRHYDEPLGTRLKEVAEAKARTLVRETEMEAAGLLVPKVQRDVAQTPLIELLESWLAVGLSPEVTAKHRVYSRNRPLKVLWECGWKYLRDVSAAGFEAWRKQERENGAKPKTLNEYLGHLKAFFGWLEQRGMILVNPLRTLKQLRVVREDSKRALTMDELQRLVEAVPWYRACVYRLAAFTGLRRAELRYLTWDRVALKGKVPHIELEASTTKNRKGGTLPLHPDAIAALLRLKEENRKGLPQVLFKGVTEMERFRKDLQLAGIEERDARGRILEFHSFRRTWATFLNGAGIAPRVAMQLMRHSDVRLTMRDYTDETLLPVAEQLGRVPSLKSSLISSLNAGNSCPSVFISGQAGASVVAAQSPENEESRAGLARVVQEWTNGEKADREGFEPSVPL